MILLRRLFKKASFFRLMSYYPPYFGAGIRIREVADDFSLIRVELAYHFWNRNYVGTQFGGSLYSMIDPLFMLMAMESLGRDYIVWDKAATIRFIKPGRSRCLAELRIEPQRLEEIRSEVKIRGKSNPVFQVQIRDDQGQLIAEADKTLSVRLKKAGS